MTTQKDLLFRQFQIRKYDRKRIVPAVNMTVEIAMDRMLEFRNELNAASGETNTHITINHFILKAIADSLKRYPALYSYFYRDKIVPNDEIVFNVPVDIESHVEYIVIHHPDTKSFTEISAECEKEVKLIRAGKGSNMEFINFLPHIPFLTKIGYLFNPKKVYSFMDKKYGNFPVSNFGTFRLKSGNITITSPIIGGVCIGSIKKEATGSFVLLTLTFDHRALDGAYGAKFLNDVKAKLEHPELEFIDKHE